MTSSGGRWIYRDVDIHRCPKPHYEKGTKAGDKWQCASCQKIWEVSDVKHFPDPRPGESYTTLEWRIVVQRQSPGVTAWRDQ